MKIIYATSGNSQIQYSITKLLHKYILLECFLQYFEKSAIIEKKCFLFFQNFLIYHLLPSYNDVLGFLKVSIYTPTGIRFLKIP